MAQEKVSPLPRHAGTTLTDRRACVRAGRFITPHQGLKEALAILLMPERPQKRSRVAPDIPSKEVLADRLRNKRIYFARSQKNAQLCIGALTSSKS